MKLAILDRIGTLNAEGENSIVALKDWMPQPGVLDAVAQLNRAGWQVTLATNQPGIGRGSFDVNELNAIHLRMQRKWLQWARASRRFSFAPTPLKTLALAAYLRPACCSRSPTAMAQSHTRSG